MQSFAKLNRMILETVGGMEFLYFCDIVLEISTALINYQLLI